MVSTKVYLRFRIIVLPRTCGKCRPAEVADFLNRTDGLGFA